MSGDAIRRSQPALLTRSFVVLLVAQASFGYAFSSFYMLPKFLVTQLSAGPAEIGRVTAAYGLAVIVFIPIMGVVVDRFGRRRFMTAGALLMAASSGAFAAVGQMGPLVYALRTAQGLAFAMVFTAGATLAVDEAPPERVGQAIALFGLTMLSMNGVASASVEAIAARAGWTSAFAAAAGSATLCVALSRFVRDRAAAARTGDVAGLRHVLRRPRQLRYFTVIALAGAALGSMYTYHQPFALELGIEKVSGFFVAYASAAIFVRVVLGHLIDRAGRRRMSIASLCLYVVAVTSMTWLSGPGELILFGAWLGAAHGFFYPALNSLAIAEVGAEERGKVMALFQAAFNVGFTASALGFGELAESAGYPPIFLASGLCVVVGLVILVASPEGSGNPAFCGTRRVTSGIAARRRDPRPP